MKINTAQKSTKKIIAISTASIVAVGLGAYGAYAAVNSSWPFASEQQNSQIATPEDTTTNQDDAPANENTTPTEPDKTQSPSKTPINNEPTNNNAPGSTTNPNTLAVTITSKDQVDGNLRIRTLIEKVASDGTCTLTLTKGAEKITRTAGVQALPSSSTCKGFSIPLSELSKGTWTLLLSVTIDGNHGTTTQTVGIK